MQARHPSPGSLPLECYPGCSLGLLVPPFWCTHYLSLCHCGIQLSPDSLGQKIYFALISTLPQNWSPDSDYALDLFSAENFPMWMTCIDFEMVVFLCPEIQNPLGAFYELHVPSRWPFLNWSHYFVSVPALTPNQYFSVLPTPSFH